MKTLILVVALVVASVSPSWAGCNNGFSCYQIGSYTYCNCY